MDENHSVTSPAVSNGHISKKLAIFLFFVGLLHPYRVSADTIAAKYKEGLVHGFLLLRTSEGTAIANGEVTQNAIGDRVTSTLVFHFKDGSIHQETTIFSQRGRFQLLSYRLIQKGPAFKQSIDTLMNVSTGQFTAHYQDGDGQQKDLIEHVDIPGDVANGMLSYLLKNLDPTAHEATFSLVAATPKPRIVKLAITSQGEEPFLAGSSSHKATHYVVKVELGGVAGVVAPIIGKQPADTHVWILGGKFPAFVRSEGPLFAGGPVWTIDLTNPVWPKKAKNDSSEK